MEVGSIFFKKVFYDPRDSFDIDLSAHLLQQYMTSHKEKMTTAYNAIHELCIETRKESTDSRNRQREPEVDYSPEQQIFVKNPFASR